MIIILKFISCLCYNIIVGWWIRMNGIAIDAMHRHGGIPMPAIPVLPCSISIHGLAYKLQYRLIMIMSLYHPTMGRA